jgi:hypothetical protein
MDKFQLVLATNCWKLLSDSNFQIGGVRELGCSKVRLKQQFVYCNRSDEPMSIQELKKQFSKEAKRDALKCLRSSSQQLAKAAYQVDELIEEFQRARIPVRRQAIVNQAIEHLVTNVLPLLKISELASIQARMAVWDRSEN